MFSDEEIKETPEGFARPGYEIISIQEVCLDDKIDKKNNLGSHLPSSSRNDEDESRDGFYPEGVEGTRFAWTEEDNIASLVSEPLTGQTFGNIDRALKTELQLQEADTSSAAVQSSNRNKSYSDSQLVSSTSGNPNSLLDKSKIPNLCKVAKEDPRSRMHFVKYVKRHGRTSKLWECGIFIRSPEEEGITFPRIRKNSKTLKTKPCGQRGTISSYEEKTQKTLAKSETPKRVEELTHTYTHKGGREFQHQYTLVRHLPTHTDERNYHCPTCGKSFRQLSTLSQHKAIHSADRPYACNVCNKSFNRVSTLISHRKTHSNEKPYTCHLCPKGFHQKGNLRNHLFTHSNERPYRCNICLKGFNQQSNLVCHKNKAHPEGGIPIEVQRTLLQRINLSTSEPKPGNDRSYLDQCEVTSSVGPTPPSTSWHNPTSWGPRDPLNLACGVIVDPIKTYYMDVAMATKQTPFALLKPNDGPPVVVKVVDTSLPGGKQMLVPATAEDLRMGGKIVLNKDGEENGQSGDVNESRLQIRVPVVAAVCARVTPRGALHLAVDEPHKAYHTAVSQHLNEVVDVEKSTAKACDAKPLESNPQPRESRYIELSSNRAKTKEFDISVPVGPSAPSPPLDLIPLDLFEPMECMPLGPQITAVDNIDRPPSSDDDDIFIEKFQEPIPLTDSD